MRPTARHVPAPSRRHAFAAVALLSLLLAGCVSGNSDEPAAKSGELDKNTLVRLADRMRAQGDLAMAAEFYQRAVAEDPQNVAAYYGLGNMYAALGNNAAADSAYREALRYDNHNAALLRDYAKLQLAQGNYGSAVLQYRAALTENGKDSKAHNGLGVALDQLGEHAAARTQYQAVLAENPDDMSAKANLGMSYIMGGDYAAAIQQLEPAANSFKATEAIRQNLALAYAKAGQSQPALSAVAPPAPTGLPEPVMTAAPRAAVSTGTVAPYVAPAATPPVAAYHAPVAQPENLPTALSQPPAASASPAAQLQPPLSRQLWKDRRTMARLTPPPSPLALESALNNNLTTHASPLPEGAAVITPVGMSSANLNPASLTPANLAAATPPVAAPVTAPAALPAALPTLTDPTTPTAPTVASAAPVAEPPIPDALAPSSFVRAEGSAIRPFFGPYPTDAVARAQQSVLQDKLATELPRKTLFNIVTELTPAGTPQFALELIGFKDQDAIDDFCASAAENGFSCH